MLCECHCTLHSWFFTAYFTCFSYSYSTRILQQLTKPLFIWCAYSVLLSYCLQWKVTVTLDSQVDLNMKVDYIIRCETDSGKHQFASCDMSPKFMFSCNSSILLILGQFKRNQKWYGYMMCIWQFWLLIHDYVDFLNFAACCCREVYFCICFAICRF